MNRFWYACFLKYSKRVVVGPCPLLAFLGEDTGEESFILMFQSCQPRQQVTNPESVELPSPKPLAVAESWVLEYGLDYPCKCRGIASTCTPWFRKKGCKSLLPGGLTMRFLVNMHMSSIVHRVWRDLGETVAQKAHASMLTFQAFPPPLNECRLRDARRGALGSSHAVGDSIRKGHALPGCDGPTSSLLPVSTSGIQSFSPLPKTSRDG